MSKTTNTATAPAALLSNEPTDSAAITEALGLMMEAGSDLVTSQALKRSGQAKMLEALTVPGVLSYVLTFDVSTGGGMAEEAATLYDFLNKSEPFVNDEGKVRRAVETGFRTYLLGQWFGIDDPKSGKASSVWTTFSKCVKSARILAREDLVATAVMDDEGNSKVSLSHVDGPDVVLEEDAKSLVTASKSGAAEPIHNEAARIAKGKPKAVSQRVARSQAKETNVAAILANADNALQVLAKQLAGDEPTVALTTDQILMLRRIEASVKAALKAAE